MDTICEDERLELIRCRRGDKQSFETIVNLYMKRAYSIALGFVGQHDDALDLSQEAFIRAYKNIKKYISPFKMHDLFVRSTFTEEEFHLLDKQTRQIR